MVLGLRSKNRKGVPVQVDYLVSVEEIRPWPTSQSPKTIQSILVQWENGDQSSGSFTSGVGDGKIEFNESFRLPTTLCREASGKSRARESFQKNCLEFYLYEPRKDKAVKGQLLGSAVINLADYGIIEENMSISAPLNCKRSFRNTAQPVLFVKIQPFEPKGSLSKEVSLDNDGSQSVSEFASEEYGEEAEIDSFSDEDDVSSHSSRTISSSAFKATGGSPSHNGENGSESSNDSTRRGNVEPALHPRVASSKPEVNAVAKALGHLNGSLSPSSSIHLPSDIGNDTASSSKFQEGSLMPILKKSVTYSVKSSSSPLGYLDKNEESGNYIRRIEQESMVQEFHEKADRSGKIQENTQQSLPGNIIDSLAAKVAPSDSSFQVGVNSDHASSTSSQANGEDDRKTWRQNNVDQGEAIIITDLHVSHPEYKEKKEQQENGPEEQILEEKKHSSENKPQDATEKQVTDRSGTLTFSRRALGVQGSNITSSKLRHVNSVQLPFDSAKSSGFGNSQFMAKAKVINIQEHAHNNSASYATNERKETTDSFYESKVDLESRMKMLEEELREAAAVEVGLYSIVAEHGSSTNKVHAPARRLSRFYLHACKARSQLKMANAASAAVSGLVLVSKACGNDVPRLTFWLSNSIVLRAIVSQAVGEMSLTAGSCTNNGGGKLDERFPSRLNESFSNEEEKNISIGSSDDWEDPQTFIIALEKIEAWIFSRIVESVWWQTLTPHMQSAAAKGSSSRKTNGRRYGLSDQNQGNFSIDLWKKAFKDACERLCPIRAGGHECGCLHVLARLVMEQLVSRLDVAMFNAILRESADEMPTDPVSDPISDSKVLPIPAGKSSFGAGAQLKNAIGNWSRWLTDLFGIDDDDSPEDENKPDVDKRLESETSFKAFHLLNALSDLMMLPLEMLADMSTRKEVCPTFGAPLVKRVLNNFVPDEFCPDPIPVFILEALDSEVSLEDDDESITSIPLDATPTVYAPPSTASLIGFMGEIGTQTLSRSGSSVLRKSYTSDDELDELDSPITSIISDNVRISASSTKPNWMQKVKGGRNVVRYKLLREVWRDGE
ncbi:hypothetical protein L1049_007253 [Liquidambar formosana]|uniref:C2 NT-type domain-containing protein n=1 Tax=Liquidambar formosana TaxID=63359 RepID=A0AAP0WUR9_LIQFO